ncbi:MAG: CDP-alcohol phosphatidyltransferase family protein [Candidatus Eisenbacteria bacterium]
MFVEHHLVELRRERFRPRAWARYVRLAFAFARERALANPAAVRSILFVGLLLFVLTLAASVAVSLLVDPTLARRLFTFTALGLFPMIGLTLLHVQLIRSPDGTALDAIGWPSAITLSRVALVPAFLVAMVGGHFRLAFLVFVCAIVSDVLDGWVARRFRQETRLGAILDPLVDILCSFWLFVGLWLGGVVPLLLFVLAGTRMLMLLAGGSYLYLTHGPVRIHSTVPGKMTGLVLTALVGMRLAIVAFPVSAATHRLTPILIDATGVLLAFTLLYGWVIGWLNLRRLRARADVAPPKVVTDVRFGA